MRFALYALAAALPLMTAAPALAAHGVAAANPMTDPPPAGYYHFQKVVYQNDGTPGADQGAYFDRLLHNVANHIAATGGKVEIRVVSFAAGVGLFRLAKTDPALASALDGLRAKGVRFLVCRNTLEAMKLTPADLYGVKPADVVPSGVAEIARLQGMGFVFEHP